MGLTWPIERPMVRWFTAAWRLWAAMVTPTAASEPARERAAAFEVFFVQHERQISHYLWRMSGDEQSASELTQETFLRAWQHFDDLRNYERPLAWLFHVATNLALQQRRRRATAAAAVLALGVASEMLVGDPARHIVDQEAVRQVLLQLSPAGRAALLLREVYGFSCSEISELLHSSRGAVKMLLLRARNQFRQAYLREEEAEA